MFPAIEIRTKGLNHRLGINRMFIGQHIWLRGTGRRQKNIMASGIDEVAWFAKFDLAIW